jgi:elongation factor G
MPLEPDTVRSVAIVGHTGSGKTMLAEAMLAAGGVIKEPGSVEAGTTVSDSTPEEKEAGRSISMGVMHLLWKGRHVQVIDAPGYFDFIGQSISALSAVDLALVTVNANAGIEVATRKMWEAAESARVPRAVVITRVDGENARFAETLEAVKKAFGPECAPVSIPNGQGKTLSGVMSLLDAKAELEGEAASMRESLVETAISSDDALLEKYLEGEEVPSESLGRVIRGAIAARALVPVLAVASKHESGGVDVLLDFIADYGPSPFESRPGLEGGEGTFEPAPGGDLVARVFRIMSDEYVGKVSFFRIFQGELKAGASVATSDGASAKIAKLYMFQGKAQEEVPSGTAGEILATAKVDELAFGATMWEKPGGPVLERPSVPKPVIERAVTPKSRGDEGKISNALRKLADEDPTFAWRQDPQTKETVVAGLGDQHLKVMFDRMKRRFQLEVNTRPPKIAYRETVTAASDVRYRHKKQTGGAGQFAEVAIKVEPNERGAGYEFVDEIFGGAIDQQFRPSVDKGIQAKMTEGIVAGFPVVDLKVRLYDGKTHPVDSKDIAFQIAGREAIKEAVQKAKPVLLEPIVNMEIAVPSRFMGDVTGDVSGRRGRILGMDSMGEMQVVRARVPAAEVQTYGSELQSLTGGEGFFAVEFSHYDVVPSNIAQQVIAQKAKSNEEAE